MLCIGREHKLGKERKHFGHDGAILKDLGKLRNTCNVFNLSVCVCVSIYNQE